MISCPADITSSLARKIRAIEQKGAGGKDSRREGLPTLSSGWAEVDAAIGGGLPCGLHEWFGLAAAASSSSGGQALEHSRFSDAPLLECNPSPAGRGAGVRAAAFRQKQWRPLVAVAIHFVSRVLDSIDAGRWAVWIGRRCFPYPAVLVRKSSNECEKGFSGVPHPSRSEGWGTDLRKAGHIDAPVFADLLLRQSLFVAPRNPADRLWAIDLALRSPAVRVVVADGSDLDMAATRRIQLVAKNHESQAFLIRPPWEQSEPSAAYSRWLVRSEPAINRKNGTGQLGTSATGSLLPVPTRADKPPVAPIDDPYVRRKCMNPIWIVELLRCKGVHWETMAKTWRLEWNRVECTLHSSPTLADSTGAAPTATDAEHDDRPRRRFASS